MASRHDDDDHLDAGTDQTTQTGTKRGFGDIDDGENDIFGSKKANIKAEETAPGVATGMILSLRESLESCKDELATCKLELEARKSEIQKWHSIFQNESIPTGTTAEPEILVSYLHDLKSSEEALRDQLENPKKKEAEITITIAKRQEQIAGVKELVDGFYLKVEATLQELETRRTRLQVTREEITKLQLSLDQDDVEEAELEACLRDIEERL